MLIKNKWIESEDGFSYQSEATDVFITRFGAHCAPVVFQKEKGGFAPYFINPWKDENLDLSHDPVLNPLRGNFFCLPFGAGGPDGKDSIFKTHGDVASGRWEFSGVETSILGDTLSLHINPGDIGGSVTKQISVKKNVIYTNTAVEGVDGCYPVGYHPNLRLPESGRMYVSNSPFESGRTDGQSVTQYKDGEYYSLKPHADYHDMSKVPMINGGYSAYPEEGFLYFSLKNQKVFGTSLMWMEDKGRHQAPWNGRTRVLGLEDTCSYFAAAVTECRNSNPMSEKGYKTVWNFSSKSISEFPYIEGVIPISPTFTKVADFRYTSNSIKFQSISGEVVSTEVELDFINS